MNAPIDLRDRRFGRLVARTKEDTGIPGRDRWRWRCDCDCGGSKLATTNALVSGGTTSCGCYRIERVRAACVTHGRSSGRTYNIWTNMRQRCNNPKHPEYHFWGGRGISVCDEWDASFEAFFADMGECPPGMSIERKDNDKGYGPGNCLWASPKHQANNRRSNRMLTIAGETLSLAMWAERTGLAYGILLHRVARNWPVERLFETPRPW